jgi:hypothetical protein
MLHPGGSQIPGVVQPVLLCQGFNAAVVLYTELELRHSLRKTSIWKCPTSFSGTGNYSAAVVSVQGPGIPLQPGGSQVPGGVQPVL